MPIGFDRGDTSGSRTLSSVLPGFDLRPSFTSDPAPDTSPSDVLVELARWSWIDIVRQLLTPTVYTRWVTAQDERVCPECGPLDGLVWEVDDGPTPPLHVNCRCQRLFAYTEWQLRP